MGGMNVEDGFMTHKVKQGDTLWGISKQYNVSVDEIKQLNHLQSNTILPNQHLKIKKLFFRVYVDNKQVGAYQNKNNALDEAWKQFNNGNENTYLTRPSGEKYILSEHKSENPEKKQTQNNHSIVGGNEATLEQMIKFTKKINPSFQEEIAISFVAVSKKYGIRGDIAFCQSILETNYFRYGGDVRSNQYNFAGIGATGNVKGNMFSTIDEGVTAQIQHLYGYATKSPLPPGEKLVDPRFHLVKRGSAPNWEDLAEKWAYPGYDNQKFRTLEEAFEAKETYGQKIIDLHQRMLKTVIDKEEEKQIPIIEAQSPLMETTHWKLEAIDWMYEQGLLSDLKWKKTPDEPLPLWAEAIVLRRMFELLKKN